MRCGKGLLIFFTAAVCAAQGVQWPLELANPPPAEPADSDGIVIKSKDELQQRHLTSKDLLVWQHSDSQYYISQSSFYELEYNLPPFQSQNHYIDFSGKAFRKNIFASPVYAGIAWAPVGIVKTERAVTGAQGWIDVGPEIGTRLFRIPVCIDGGLSGRTWNDIIRPHPFDTLLKATQHVAGFFGSMNAGDYSTPVSSILPVHFTSSVYGRNIGDSRKVIYTGTASIAQDLSTGDSIYILYNDAYSDAQNTYLGKLGETGFGYASTHRRGRTFQFMSGIRGKPMFNTVPGLAYIHSDYSNINPTNALLDERKRNDALMFLLATSETAFLTYSGGLRMEVEQYDKLFTMQLKGGAVPLIDRRYTGNIQDYNGFISSTQHRIAKYFGDSTGVEYEFSISRNSKTYPNSYIGSSETLSTYYDNDRILQHHILKLTPIAEKKFKGTLSGEYYRNLDNYIHRKWSKNNETTNLYTVGASLTYTPTQSLTFNENLSGIANASEYMYPDFHLTDPAPYSRLFISKFSSEWKVHPSWILDGIWSETYRDNGYWKGKKLSDSNGYYAVWTKAWKHELDLSASMNVKTISLRAGSQFGDIYDLTYLNRSYSVNSFGVGYTMVPYVSMQGMLFNRYALDFILKRYIDTIHDDYWNMELTFQAMW